MKKKPFRKLLRIHGEINYIIINSPLEKLIFEKFSEETEFAGKVEQPKV